ncbi:copper chaperone PCu(A)C [Lysobacter humi (ex Lee et al. 2017)]
MHLRHLVVAFVLLASASGAAARTRPCAPVVTAPWVRMAPASMPMGAAFAVIENRCVDGIELVGVSSPDFGSVSMHETRVDAGVSRMRPVARLAVPTRERVTFRPGGLHVMLSRPQRALGPGKVVRLVFLFSDGSSVRVDAPVRDSAP